ncbi:MAG: toprim domain-containing protein [Candidatus Nanohalobium sp.]
MEKEKFVEKKRLEEIVSRINRDVDSIIVEGYSDRIAMEKLGFNGKIFLSAERSHEDLAEDISRGADRIAILTDFDSHGKKQNRELSKILEEDVDVVTSIRKEFGAQLTSNDRRAVEDVAPLFVDKEQKFVEAALDQLFFNE